MHLERPLQFGRIHVPLEGMLLLREHRFIDDQVEGHAPLVKNIGARGIEMDVIGHQIALLEGDGKEQVLGGASLVGGNDMPEAEEGVDGLLKVVIIFAARIGFITHHHPGPLMVAHRRSAAVGEQIDVDTRSGEPEHIESRFTDELVALLAGGPAQGFDDLDPERFSREIHKTSIHLRLPARAGMPAHEGSSGFNP